MKETGMLFNGAMVRALLDGRKTQTRRIIKDQPKVTESRLKQLGAWNPDLTLSQHVNQAFQSGFVDVKCPFGQVGDRIWVRETFALSVIDPDGGPPEDDPENYDVIYREGDQPDGGWTDGAGNKISAPWKPSLHMPRWASRITLEITDVRIERLHDISEADAIAEGLAAVTKDGKLFKHGIPDLDGLPGRDNLGWPWHEWEVDPRDAFKKIWESTGGDWNANPWVWVIEFKTLETGAA